MTIITMIVKENQRNPKKEKMVKSFIEKVKNNLNIENVVGGKNKMNNVMERIKLWKLEAFDTHNDGWTQNGYRKNLIKLKEYLNSIENLELHGEQTDG